MKRGLIAALAAALLLCGACTDGGDQVSEGYEVSGGAGAAYDEELSKRLRDLSGRGGTGKLADLTDFTWDRVHVFSEGALAKEVEQVAGEPVLSGKRYYDQGRLLVFENNGKVAKAVSVIPDVLVTDGKRTWGADTVLKPQSPTRPALLRLTDA